MSLNTSPMGTVGFQSVDGATWTTTTVPAGSYYGIAYGSGTFVAVAQTSPTLGTGKVATSQDGITWADVTPANTALQNLVQWSAVAFGAGTFVAVALDQSKAAFSTDNGQTWTAVTVGANWWTSVCYGNSLFVAVAKTGTNRVMTSPDGITWSTPSLPTGAGSTGWKGVAYGAGLFVAINDNNGGVQNNAKQFLTSPDGVTWTYREAGLGSRTYWTTWSGIAFGNGKFVIVGNSYDSSFSQSADGLVWT